MRAISVQVVHQPEHAGAQALLLPMTAGTLKKSVKHPQGLIVWRCFMLNVLGALVVFHKNITVTKKVYLELILGNLESSFEMIGYVQSKTIGAVTFHGDFLHCKLHYVEH